MNKNIESAIFLIGFGLLLLLVNFMMFRPITMEFMSDPKLVDSYPADSFGIIASYYLTFIGSMLLLFFGALSLIRFFFIERRNK